MFVHDEFVQLEESLLSFLESCDDPVTAEWHIPTAVDALLRNGEASCRVLASRGDWFGVTHREDRAQAVETIGKLVSAGEYPSPLG